MEYQVILNQADTEEEKQMAMQLAEDIEKKLSEKYISEKNTKDTEFSRQISKSPRNIGPDSAGRKMVDMSEIYKNKKKALVRGSGDLATGVGVALYRAGFQVIMTDIAVPLTVRREVATSRAVYEGRAKVEGIEGILVRSYQEALAVLEENKIAVIVDPKAEICKEFHPDLLVDAILAKKNMGTRRTDAPYVIGLGPGFTAGKDVHAVIETMRGETLADIIYDGQPIPNTGVPGYVGGYALERLIRASGNGRMEPKAQIGDIVKKGQLLAVTGGKPVYSQLDGVIRGMLQEGVQVKKV